MLAGVVLRRTIILYLWLATTLCSACSSQPGDVLEEDVVLDVASAQRCNGFEALCDRRVNEVAFAATHNAMSNEEDGWWGPNQEAGLTRQMEDGIRGMLLDSYEIEGELLLCHGFCELGSQPLDEALGEINAFLTANPHEVMILFFQDAVGSEAMSQAIEESGLGSLVYTHTEGQDFPTLGDLIEQNTRVIIASESHGPPPPWYHYGWDLFFDTPYSFKSVEEFSCSLNRGQSGNPLFLLNHWLADSVGLPSKKAATTANSFDVLYERAKSCWDEHDHIPNLVAVDFYATGDLMAVVNALNGVLSEEKSTSTE